MFFFRFAALPFFIGAISALACALLLRIFLTKQTYYRFSLGSWLKKQASVTHHPHRIIFYLLRFFCLVTLAFLVGKPQIVDSRSKIDINGIDIMMVLDVSGSMFQIRDAGNNRSRFDVAQEEAVRFIEKRTNDALGLTLFGKEAVSRCPLTIDKHMVKKMVSDVQFGDVDPDGTVIAKALLTAANRLKKSQSKSKIMILLTDGEPSPDDIKASVALEVIQKMEIKVYTVGFGSEKQELMLVPGYGLVPKPTVNTELLQLIAEQTGGKFFMAHNAEDMRTIYNTIDQLEKSDHEAPHFSRYFDIFAPCAVIVLLLLCIEFLLRTFVWFTI